MVCAWDVVCLLQIYRTCYADQMCEPCAAVCDCFNGAACYGLPVRACFVLDFFWSCADVAAAQTCGYVGSPHCKCLEAILTALGTAGALGSQLTHKLAL
jgi:hypothetical protein